MQKTMISKKILIKLIGWKFNTIGVFSPKLAFGQAMDLFSKPRNGRVLSFQKKYLDSFTKSVISVKGSKIQTYQKGKGPIKILLAHGWESNSWRWRKLIQHLGLEEYTFMMLDAPGHGTSESESFDMVDYVEGIKIMIDDFNPDYIIGHSMGGLAVMLSSTLHQIPNGIKIISMGAPHSLDSIFQKYFSAIGLSERIKSKKEKLFFEKYGRKIEEFSIQSLGPLIVNEGLILHDVNDTTNEIENAEMIDKAWAKGNLIMTELSNHSMQHVAIFDIIKDYTSSKNQV
jgi:esterase/lipase